MMSKADREQLDRINELKRQGEELAKPTLAKIDAIGPLPKMPAPPPKKRNLFSFLFN